jgi:hypothetical protein
MGSENVLTIMEMVAGHMKENEKARKQREDYINEKSFSILFFQVTRI